jgi:AcrR family transcriptional regulator
MAHLRAHAGIDREMIIDAALELLDEQGAKALTGRNLAARLNVTPPVVYWHVGNKESLWGAVAERVIGRITVPSAPDRPWPDQVSAFFANSRQELLAHPGVIDMTGMARGPSMLVWGQEALRIMRAAGLDEDDAPSYANLMLWLILGYSRMNADVRSRTALTEPFDDGSGREFYRVRPELVPDDADAGELQMATVDVDRQYEILVEMFVAKVRTERRARRRG